MKDLVPKADGFNFDETGIDLSDEGGVKPIRKRGYYRALKSKKLWALERKARINYLTELNKMLFLNPSEILRENIKFSTGLFWGEKDEK